MARIFVSAQRMLRQALRDHAYDRADIVRRTTEEWRDYVERLDRAADRLED